MDQVVTQWNEGRNHKTSYTILYEYKCYQYIKESCDAYKDKEHWNQISLCERIGSRQIGEDGIC